MAAGAPGVAAASVDPAPASLGFIHNAGVPGALPGRYIVTLKSAPSAATESVATAVARAYRADVGVVYRHALSGFSAAMTETQARQLAADPRVAVVEQDRQMYALETQTDPKNWGLDRIDQRPLPLNQSFTHPNLAGLGVTAYVLDTGINANHTDFTGRLLPGRDFVDNDNIPADCHGHGTHVAGILAGSTFGVAKHASVVPVRVLGCTGTGSLENITAAIDWVRLTAPRPAVVNYSIGCRFGCDIPVINLAVRNLIESGITWVQAAGNSNADACLGSPQRVTEGITVGNSAIDDSRRSTSSWGTCVDLFAPGTDINSASHSDNTGFVSMTGTSMSSPHVAGAAAAYLSQNRGATPQQVQAALVANGTTGVLRDIGTGSPNVLLYTGFLAPGPTEVFWFSLGAQHSDLNEPANLSPRAIGGKAPYRWSATGLPPGLNINPASGVVSGAPRTAGRYPASITVTDSSAPPSSFRVDFSWTVWAPIEGTCSLTQSADRPITFLYNVISDFTASGCGTAVSGRAKVSVRISHPDPDNVELTLFSPRGNRYGLKFAGTGTAGGARAAARLDQTFAVNLSEEPADGRWALGVRDMQGNGRGVLESWTLNLGGGLATHCIAANASVLQVPDMRTVSVPTESVGCAGTAGRADAQVSVTIYHERVGDLVVTLIAQDGSRYVLHNREGGSTDDLLRTYSVNLSSEPRNSTWTLEVSDQRRGTVGTLVAWSVRL